MDENGFGIHFIRILRRFWGLKNYCFLIWNESIEQIIQMFIYALKL